MYLALLGISLALYALIIFVEFEKSRVLSPVIVVITTYYVFYVVRSYLIYLNQGNMDAYFYMHYFEFRHVVEAMLVFVPSIVNMYLGFRAGYRSGRTYRIGVSLDELNAKKLFYINFILFSIWLVSVAYKYAIGFQHYGGEVSVAERLSYGSHYILSIIVSFFEFSFYFLLYIYYKHGLVKPLFIVALIAKIAVLLFSGSALGFLFLLFAFAILHFFPHYFEIDRSYIKVSASKMLLYGCIFLVILTAVYTLKMLVRHGINNGLDQSLTLANILDFSNNVSFAMILESMMSRFIGADTLANIISNIDSGILSHSSGEMFYFLIIGLIPRFILQDKPQISLATWYTDNSWNLDIAANGYQGTGVFFAGELYLNFGYWCVVLGFLFVGYILGRLYSVTFFNQYKMFSYVFMATLSVYYVIFEFTFSAWMVGLFRVFVMLYFYSMLVKLIARITWGGRSK